MIRAVRRRAALGAALVGVLAAVATGAAALSTDSVVGSQAAKHLSSWAESAPATVSSDAVTAGTRVRAVVAVAVRAATTDRGAADTGGAALVAAALLLAALARALGSGTTLLRAPSSLHRGAASPRAPPALVSS